MAAGAEFVEGWLVAQVLGEGAYGEVRLLVHARSGAAVALKVVRGAGEAGAAAREAALHRALRHPHVLRCLGERTHQGLHYMFLEYAPGGELFDRIEPDVGMREEEARRYWRQLLSGLAYLHGRGVAHRDIKPENLLLDNRDQLKISDFGMATLFRHGARERLLSRVCGTAPYAAPEVLRAGQHAYRAPPADLWAAALVLLAMLAGELPWERACETDERYAAWSAWAGGAAAGAAPRGPWSKLAAPALALLRRALQPEPERRAPLPALLELPWLREPADLKQMSFEASGRDDLNATLSDLSIVSQRVGLKMKMDKTKVMSNVHVAPVPVVVENDTLEVVDHYTYIGQIVQLEGAARAWRSQPTAADLSDLSDPPDQLSVADMDELISYSQPAHADDLLLATPADAALTSLGRRMTRVWLRGDEGAAMAALADVLRQRGYVWRRLHPRLMAIECGTELKMRAWAMRCGGDAAGGARTLLEFRRSRGCGLQFKRRYVELRDALQPLHAPAPPHAELLHVPHYAT